MNPQTPPEYPFDYVYMRLKDRGLDIKDQMVVYFLLNDMTVEKQPLDDERRKVLVDIARLLRRKNDDVKEKESFCNNVKKFLKL
jgi:hypothetical protein